jgi:putative copper resistance protein D
VSSVPVRSIPAAALLAGAALLLGTVGAALAIAVGGADRAQVALRLVTDLAGTVALGLAGLPLLLSPRWREVVLARAAAPLTVCAAGWVVGGAAQIVLAAARRAGVPVTAVDMSVLGDAGPAAQGLIPGALAALALTVWALLGLVRDEWAPPPSVALPVAGFGMIAGPATGHLALATAGPVVVTVHVVAAAWWCGSLAAMALVLRGREQWADALPRFSRVALPVVILLGLTGVTALLLHTTALTSRYALVGWAKAVVLVVAIGVAAAARRMWLPAVTRRAITDDASVRRAIGEVAVLALAFGLAAGLSLTP